MILYLPLLLSLWASSASSQPSLSQDVLDNEFLSGINNTRIAYNVSGLTISVVRDDTVETAAFGIKSEDGSQMTIDTLFHIASCSKSFTATAMGMLMDDFERGLNKTALPPGVEQFNWHTKVKDLLPGEWGLENKMASEYANIHDILSHVTGLPRHDLAVRVNCTLSELVNTLRRLRSAYELRERFSYNNLMYAVAVHIINKYAGMPFRDFIQERLFNPLNMTSATYNPNPPNLSEGWSKSGRLLAPLPIELPHQIDVEAGSGGIVTNVHDLSQYLKVLLHGGTDPATNATIIPRSVWEAITTPYAVGGMASSYGMGWIMTAYHGSEFISHTGGYPGYTSLLVWVPSKNRGLALLINGDVAVEVLRYVQNRFLEKIFNLPPSDAPKPPSAPDNVIYSEERLNQQQVLSPSFKYSVLKESSPTHSLVEYEGVYLAKGYPDDILICHSSSSNPSCSPALDTFSTLGPLDPTHLYALWPDSAFITHLHFIPSKNGDGYDLELTRVYPDGYGKDTSPFELVVLRAPAKFEVVEGVVRGWGFYQPDVHQTLRVGTSVEEQSDIWFAKKQ